MILRQAVVNCSIHNDTKLLQRAFLRLYLRQFQDRQIAVCPNRVAAAVSRVITGGKIFQDRYPHWLGTILYCLNNIIALNVGILVNPMRQLKRKQRQADTSVIRSRGQPIHPMSARQQPTFRAAPKTHMMALIRVIVDFLLISKILLAPKQKSR